MQTRLDLSCLHSFTFHAYQMQTVADLDIHRHIHCLFFFVVVFFFFFFFFFFGLLLFFFFVFFFCFLLFFFCISRCGNNLCFVRIERPWNNQGLDKPVRWTIRFYKIICWVWDIESKFAGLTLTFYQVVIRVYVCTGRYTLHDMTDNLLKVLSFQHRLKGCHDGHFREKSYPFTYAN